MQVKNKHSHPWRMKAIIEEIKVEALEVKVRMEEEEEEARLEEEEGEIIFLMVTKPIVQAQEEDLVPEVEEKTRRICNVIIVTSMVIMRGSVGSNKPLKIVDQPIMEKNPMKRMSCFFLLSKRRIMESKHFFHKTNWKISSMMKLRFLIVVVHTT